MDRIEPDKCAMESSDALTPEEAFALIGDATRVTILEALWQIEERPVPFSTLYENVDVETSAQFNYHLDQLTGHFVQKRADGYELRTAGEHVVRAIVEGSFTAHPTVEPFPTGDNCVACETELQAYYADETLTIECEDCGHVHAAYSFPPGGLLDRTEQEILTAFEHHVRQEHTLATAGVCPACRARLRVAVETDGDAPVDVGLSASFVCDQCQHRFHAPIGLTLLDRPPIVSFYETHGTDLRSIPFWQLEWCVSDELTTVQSTGPVELRVEIPLADGQLVVDVDSDLRITSVHRGETPDAE